MDEGEGWWWRSRLIRPAPPIGSLPHGEEGRSTGKVAVAGPAHCHFLAMSWNATVARQGVGGLMRALVRAH